MNMQRAPDIQISQAIPGIAHPSGCNTSCMHSHLTAVALDRLVKAGIDIGEIRAALDDESFSHEDRRGTPPGLSPAGRKNLLTWGATSSEIAQIEGMDVTGQPEPTGLTFAERERRRVQRYRAGLSPAERRARDAANSKRYRERQKQRDGENRPGG